MYEHSKHRNIFMCLFQHRLKFSNICFILLNIDLILSILMRSGTLIKQLASDFTYKAFIPGKLPYRIKEDAKLHKLLSKADLSLGRLDGIVEVLPDVDFFLFMYKNKEATLSSQIEGTRATLDDYLKDRSKIQNLEKPNDVDEIRNYIYAMSYGLERLNKFPLSLPLIQEIHKRLLHGVRGKNKNPGEFRRTQNWIGGASLETAMYIPPPVYEMKELLSNLEKWIHEKDEIPVLIKSGLIHYQFETIHPFLDGNGRIGRLLIAFYLCQQRILKKPLLYLSQYFKENKQEYYDRLTMVRQKDDIEGWLKFFLEGVRIISDDAVNTIERINELKKEDELKIANMGKSQASAFKLYNKLFKSPFTTVKNVEDIASIANPNAINLVTKFEKSGILKEITGKKKNKVYCYQKYLNQFK